MAGIKDVEHIFMLIWKEPKDQSRKAVVSGMLNFKNMFIENKLILYQTVKTEQILTAVWKPSAWTFRARRRRAASGSVPLKNIH